MNAKDEEREINVKREHYAWLNYLLTTELLIVTYLINQLID